MKTRNKQTKFLPEKHIPNRKTDHNMRETDPSDLSVD